MAEATTAAHPADALTSPSTVNGAWALAVPVTQEVSDNATKKRRTSNDSNSAHPRLGPRHRTPGVSTRSRNSSQSASGRSSSQDIYARDTTSMSATAVMESGETIHHPTHTGKSEIPKQFYAPTNGDPNGDSWIHRDKLARIESEELQLAAIRIQRQVRTGSKSSSTRGRSHDSHNVAFNGTVATPPPTEHTDSWPSLQRPQLDSLIPLEGVGLEEGPSEVERMNWDLRRPEEITGESNIAEFHEDDGVSKIYRGLGLRKSSSRIPVLATSPHPISQEYIDREFPIQRKRTRTLSGGGDESVADAKPRQPSECVVIDSPEVSSSNGTPTPSNASRPNSGGDAAAPPSPAKKTLGAKGTSQPTARKTSVPPSSRKTSTQQKPRAPSGSSMNKDRPVTRAGENRPQATTINRVESDPPWLATMYKPDPRLPPDLQILPTHAKRMQQEQWEKEGKTPSTYDREFAALAVRPERPPQEYQEPETVVEQKQEQEKVQEPEVVTWPPKSPRSPDLPNRPGTSGTGYSTMPKVQQTPPIGVLPSPKLNQQTLTIQEQAVEKEKGCWCCIIM